MATDHDPLDPGLERAIRGLSDREPAHDLWPDIARRIAPARPALRLRWPVAIAAALALLLGGGLIDRMLTAPQPVASSPDVAAPAASSPDLLPAGFDRAEGSLTTAIDQLQAAYAEAAPRLDPEVQRAIAASLASLDSAIDQARARTGKAPDDINAARYLTRTMQRKLGVLRTAATMATRS